MLRRLVDKLALRLSKPKSPNVTQEAVEQALRSMEARQKELTNSTDCGCG